MKKTKIISLVLILVMALSFLPACWFADSATIADCYNLYQNITTSYAESKDIDNSANSLITFYPKDLDEEPYFIRAIKFDYSSNELLLDKIITEDSNFYEFSLLGNEFQKILDNALYPFYYYKSLLTSWNNDIEQKLKTSLYNSIEDLDDDIKGYINSKNVLESYFDGTNKNFSLELLETCVYNYFNIINSALKVSENAINCALNVVDFPAEDYVIKTEDTTYIINTLLATSNKATRLITNYYEQYTNFHGFSKLNYTTSTEQEFTTLLSIYNNGYYSNIYSKLNTVTQIQNGYETFSPDTEKVSKAIKNLKYLQIAADEMVLINEELGKEIPKAENNYDEYLYYQKYLNILAPISISGTESSLYYCYKI